MFGADLFWELPLYCFLRFKNVACEIDSLCWEPDDAALDNVWAVSFNSVP